MKNIHILATDQPSRLCIDNSCDELNYSEKEGLNSKHITNQCMYITSSEEIGEGWCFNNAIGVNRPIFVRSEDIEGLKKIYSDKVSHLEKIILTTNKLLIADGVQAIDDGFLEWYVKNPTCEFVEVSELRFFNPDTNKSYHCKWEYDLPQEEPKQSKWDNLHKELDDALENMSEADWLMLSQKYKWGHHKQEVSSGGEKYVFGTAKGEYTIGITSPNTAKGEYGLAIGFNPETANTAYAHHSIVIGNGLTTTEPYQLLVDRNGIKIDKIMTIEEYELLSQVLKSINDIKF